MKLSAKLACIGVLFLIVFTVPALCGEVISIQVAPSTLNLKSGGTLVTVHTDIAYGSVLAASVTLNGIEISWWKADDCGNFVAKFDSDEVKALYEDFELPETVIVTLEGLTSDGEAFSGTDTITVINKGR